jgi:rhodanese-related sulfurtransferase
MEHQTSMNTIDTQTQQLRLDSDKDCVWVDTLPPPAYQKAHLPYAINILSDDIIARAAAELTKKDPVIVGYCGSLDCKPARLSATRLTDLGYTEVYHYVDGKRGWSALPFVMGATQ